ncbi:flagellar hook-associated protein FlgK [Phenylobacterium sp.]|uniref:flagellar hook-associated protein FlgK n=1 Tax=Phenylobacterium sp. TaxID=1871053 RepID=UPI00286D4232|nr:flagellar hook-associated protein FlgK [Phenylobacterium sp.]
MSLGVALQSATSGLMAAQTGLRAISDNIANVNTPGYVRKVIDQQQLVVAGMGQGVSVIGVRRVTDQYLQLASMTAGSDAAKWGAYAKYLDNAQALFGNPSGKGFFFNGPDDIAAAFATAANDPSSSLLRGQALSTVSSFLNDANRISGQIAQLGQTVDAQVSDSVGKANGLLSQIAQLNSDIGRARISGGDSSGSENIQSQLLNQLSSLMNVRVSARDQGGVTVRSSEGVMLAGDGASTLTYNRTDATSGYITAVTPGAASDPQPLTIASGQIRGLLDLRDTKLPGIADQLGEFVSRTAEQLNAAHNASSAFPAPSTLTGRNTGLDLPTAITGFTGQTTVAIVNAAGVLQRRVDIDFSAGTMSVDGGASSAFTPATFLSSLNTALGAFGAATFTGGALSIAAAGANGVAIAKGTADKDGKGFSHAFGLNDLIRSGGLATFDTGLAPGDANGFIPGETLTLRLSQPDGKPIRDVTVAIPPAGSPSMTDLLSALNNSTTGVGLYGAFALDAQGGLAFSGNPPIAAKVAVVGDNTHRGPGGPSVSQLFGLGAGQRANRAGSYFVDPALVADPTRVALGKLDLTVAAGAPTIRPGDGQGALALSQANTATTLFKAAGDLGNISTTLARYAAEFGGSIGRDAAAADTQKSGAGAVQTEADARRQAVEGVNIDEELVRLTTYQQAFNASARMIQASKDLFDALMQIR